MGPVAVVTALVVAMFGGLIVYAIAMPFGGSFEDPPAAANLVATLVQDAVFVGVAIAFAAGVSRPYAADFGLRPPAKPGPAIGWSALTYVAIGVVGVVASAAFGVGEDQQQENILDDLGVDPGSAMVYAWAAVVCVLAPLCEELLFRGFVFPAMRPRLGVFGAALASGAIFGAIHITNYAGEEANLAAASIVTLVFLGTAFALLYWKTGSLLPCIALHAVNNSVAFGLMQDWTWEIAVLLPLSLAACGLAVWAAMRFWRPSAPSFVG
jgi:hypothetical protein